MVSILVSGQLELEEREWAALIARVKSEDREWAALITRAKSEEHEWAAAIARAKSDDREWAAAIARAKAAVGTRSAEPAPRRYRRTTTASWTLRQRADCGGALATTAVPRATSKGIAGKPLPGGLTALPAARPRTRTKTLRGLAGLRR